MKKILLFLLLIFYSTNVYAYTYYTEYGEEVITQDYIEQSDLISVEKRFKFYHENIELGPYTNDINSKNYRYIDYDDYIKVKSNYFKTKPELKDNRVIYEKKDKFVNSKVSYLIINNIRTSDEKIVISDLKVLNDDIAEGYGYSCSPNCEVKVVNDSYVFELYRDTILKIGFKKLYSVDNLNIQFKVVNDNEIKESFYMYLGNDVDLREKYDTEVLVNNTYLFDLKGNGLNYTTGFYNTSTLYYYEDYYYRSFNKTIEYDSDYTTLGSTYYNKCDNNDYIYVYKKRDKLELKDKLLINSPNYNLKDFITSNTSDVKIVDNIDISKDGIYKVEYKINNNTFDAYFTVDINQDDYNTLISIIENYDKSDKSKSEIINTLNNENNTLNKKINELVRDKSNILLNIDTQKQAQTYESQKKDNNPLLQIGYSKLSIIVLSLFSVIILTYVIIKHKKYN